jgi:hypothetical protein
VLREKFVPGGSARTYDFFCNPAASFFLKPRLARGWARANAA